MAEVNEVVVLSNDTVECSVIGSILRYNELYTQNRDVLIPNFFHGVNVNIFTAIKELLDKGNAATPVTVTALLDDKKQGGNRFELQRMVALCDADTFNANIRKLEDYYKRNMARLYFQQCADEAVKMGMSLDDTLNNLQREIKNLLSGCGNESIVSASEAMKRIKQHVLDVRDGKVSPGIKTGFRIFDVNYGLHEDDLIIIAARTGVGKSALAMNMSTNIARQGIGVAYYSSEMSVNQLWSRVISYDMKMRSLAILNEKLSDQEMNRLSQVADNYEKYPLFIDEEASVQFSRVIRSIRKMNQSFGVKVFVVDYLQIVRMAKNFDSEAQKLAFITRELKNIALELHVVVLLLSQLNRGGVKDGVITKFGLRGSGEIEEAADTVVMIDRPDADPNTKGKKFEGNFSWVPDTTNKAIFRLDKGRSTGNAEFLVDFLPEYTLFVDNCEESHNTEFAGDCTEKEKPFEEPEENVLPF